MDQQSDPQPDEGLQQPSLEHLRQILGLNEWQKTFLRESTWLNILDPFGPLEPGIIGGSIQQGSERAPDYQPWYDEMEEFDEEEEEFRFFQWLDGWPKPFLRESTWQNTPDPFGYVEEMPRIRRGGAPAFFSYFSDEDIISMPRRGLRVLSKDKSITDIVRDKMKGELAARRFAKFKGKAVATSSYIGESSSDTSSRNSPIPTEIPQRSELDRVSIPPAPSKFSMTADRSKCASAGASGRGLNGHSEGTLVTTGSGSPESTAQHYPLPHSTLPASASRNEQVRLQEPNAKCRDNPSVGRAGKTVFSSEPTARHQQSAAYAPTDADIEAGAFTTFSEPPQETTAIWNELPLTTLLAGAFAVISGNPETFRGAVGWVLLGVMTVGFICRFMWLLMGGRRWGGKVSSLLQWTGVWSVFVAFLLAMALLISH